MAITSTISGLMRFYAFIIYHDDRGKSKWSWGKICYLCSSDAVKTAILSHLPPSRIGRDPRAAWISAGLAGAVFLTFWPILRNGFVNYDDNVFILGNKHVRAGLTWDGIRWALTSFEHSNWHPMTWWAFMFNMELFGTRPGGHHFMSLLWHVLATMLLFHALRRMTGRLWASAFTAALFALHPLRVESVAWAVEIKDPIAGGFFMLTLLAYVRYVERPTLSRYLPVAISFIAALMTKPSVIPLPFLLLLLDFWPFGRLRPTEKIPLFLMSISAAAVTYLAQAGSGAVDVLTPFPPAARIANALVAFTSYIGKFLRPSKLAVFYPHPGGTIPIWKIAAAAVLLSGFSVAAIRGTRRRPWIAAGWCWYLVMILPVSGIVQVGLQGMADRFTYLPLIGLAIISAWSAAGLAGSLTSSRPYLIGAAAAALLALALVTRVQIGYWRDDGALFQRALRVTERNWTALTGYGAALIAEGRFTEAIPLLRKSVEIMPNYGFTYFCLGNALAATEKTGEAVILYRRGIQLSPHSAPFYNNLGAALVKMGRIDEATEQFRAALRVAPDYLEAETNLKALDPLMRRLSEPGI